MFSRVRSLNGFFAQPGDIMANDVNSNFLTWLKNRLPARPWNPAPTKEADLNGLNEMPRFPIRAALLVFFALALAFLLVVFREVGNPLAAVQDSRRGTTYNREPLTSLAVGQSSPAVWVGSAGGGIKTYDAQFHYFRDDITVESSRGALLGNFIQDLAVQSNPHPIAAIALAQSNSGPAGVQLGGFGFSPEFWRRPVVGFRTFDGISDTNASCVIATADQSYLLIGTRGFGLGIYDVAYHTWTGTITTREGLPSDVVNDLAAMPGANDGVVWIATAGGLCGGRLNDEGRFAREWTYTSETGLAGRAIKRLLLSGTNLWYVTDGGGLGRVVLQPSGSPLPGNAVQTLVTERSIPGLRESTLGWVRGSSLSRDTWFTGKTAAGDRVGRHREHPYDTTSLEMPGDLKLDAVQCAAADPGAAPLYLLGTDRGAYFFATPGASNTSPVAPIVSGPAGLEGVNILEAALSGNITVVKHGGAGGFAGLQTASATPSSNWSWTPLVGTNRFPGLESQEQVLCAAGDGRRVFFGTEGKGIGVWDRAGAEMRLEYHTSFKDATKLHSDTSLDLAWSDGILVQVTGDHAVDALTATERLALVPPGELPMRVADIVAADAMGSWLVCASARRSAQYDMRSFSWGELPALPDLERLALSRGRIWAVTAAGKLFHLALTGENRAWSEALEGVTDWAVNTDRVQVLARDGAQVGLYAFDATDGKKISSILPVPRAGGPPRWRFAALQDQKLWLVGDSPRVEIYDLQARAWSAKDFPAEVQAPLALARRSARAWWFLDHARSLHAFNFADRTFDVDRQRGVEQMDAAADAAVAVLGDLTNTERLVRLREGGAREPLVGAGFGGDLSRASDMIEERGEIIAAQGAWIGRYAWRDHAWKSFQAPVESISRFHQAAGAVWAETGGAGASSAHALAANKLHRVHVDNEPVTASLVRADAARLLMLSSGGAVLAADSRSPSEARTLLAAEKMPGNWPANSRLIASLGGWLAVADGTRIHFYGSARGPAGWRTVEVGEDVVSLCASPRDQHLIAVTASSIYAMSASGRPAQGGKPRRYPADGRLIAASVSDTDLIGATQVSGETGARVWVAALSGNKQEIIGPALPPSAPTKTILEPQPGQLLRLDAAGRVGRYNESTRSWTVETTPAPLDEMWVLGRGIVAWSKPAKTLLRRDPSGGWSPIRDFAREIEAAQSFPAGLVLQLSSGALAWHNERGGSMVRESRAARGFPSGFGAVSDAAEFSNVLYLLDQAGRLALFDWDRQQWCGFKGGLVRRLIAASDGVFVIEERDGKSILSGPLSFSHTGAESRPVGGTPNVASSVAVEGKIYFISGDGGLYHVTGGSSQKLWSDPAARAVVSSPTLQAALRVGTEFWLIVSVSDRQSALMRVEARSLASSVTMLPPGRVERILSLGAGVFCASLVSTNGRYPVSLPRAAALASPRPDVTEILTRDHQLLALTTSNTIPLNPLGGVGWRPDLAQPALTAAERSNLLATAETELEHMPLVPSPRGWKNPAAPGGLAIAITNAGQAGATVSYLLPAADRLALAHERATGLATDGTRLFVTTPGGALEVDPASPLTPVGLHNQGPDGPMPELAALEWVDDLRARTASANWRLQNQTWVPAPPVTATDRARVQNDFAAATLKNWRRVPGNAQSWQRQFASGHWRAVELTANGFNFERTIAAEVRDGSFLAFTHIGTLVFRPGETAPNDLLPSWAAPAGLPEGTVIPLDEQTSLLAPTGPGPNQLWVRGADTWEPAGPQHRQALSVLPARPFLDTKSILWGRPQGGASAEPVTQRSGPSSLAGFFHPEAGRFDWETCLQLGQARGEHWALTRSGLLRISAQGLDLSSVVPVPANLDSLVFANTSGDQPGALLREARVEWVFDQSWKPVAQSSREAQTLLVSHGHISETWRAQRAGGVERALPQSPGAFAPVHLQTGRRWDFETVTDVDGDGQNVVLATAFGVVMLDERGGLKELWPMPGVRQVGLVNGSWQADSTGGRHELKNGRWSSVADPAAVHPASVVAEGAWFRIERQFPGVALQFRPKAGAPFRPLVPGPRRFPFDDPSDAAIASAQSVACATKAGLLTRTEEGDIALEEIAAATFADGRFFCRVPDSDNDSTLHVSGAGGNTWTFQQGWHPSPQRTAEAALALSQHRLAVGQQWHVSAPSPAEVEFELHLAGEPPDVLRRISLAPDHTGFAVDRFTSVAVSGESKIILGSQGGLQRIDADGVMQRLWADSGSVRADGLPLEVIERTLSDGSGAVQILAAGKHYTLASGSDLIRASNAEAFNRALAERHVDPSGWRVDLDSGRTAPPALRWKGEPVFLMDQPGGVARFAHNLVHCALQTTDGLWLGTEGGLIVLPSALPSAIERMTLVVKPFLPANANDAEKPAPLNWMGRSDARTGVLLNLGGPRGGFWQGSASNPAKVSPVRGKAPPIEPGAQDDLLVWTRPGPGRVQISFTPGWVFPESATPRIQNGTFTFLDLNTPRVQARPESLAAMTNRFVWATHAGLVTMTRDVTNHWRLHTETESRATLADVTSVQFDAETGTAWAARDGASFRLEVATGAWTRDQRPARLHVKTPRTIWADGESGRPRLAHTDAPEAPWLEDGKPAIDRVLDVAVIPGPDGDAVLVASPGGVVAYAAGTFAHLGVQAAAFQTGSQALANVTELASLAGEGSSPVRLCARSDGRGFERTEGKWSAQADVSGVFELSYRRVRQTNQWNWSRHPAGLSVELPHVNGDPVWLGRGLDPSRLPIFSRGRVSMDDVRCVAFAGPQLLLGSAVGIVRFDLDAGAGRTRFAGIDLWATASGGKAPSPTLTNLTGLFSDGAMLAWSSGRTFTNQLAGRRDWSDLNLAPQALFSSRVVAASHGSWVVDQNEEGEFAVRFQRDSRGKKFYVPARGGSFRHVFHSPDGLWVLSSNWLYQCNQDRLDLVD